MPQTRTLPSSILRHRRATLLAAAALAVLGLAPAQAQEANLRGEVAEQQVEQDLRARRSVLEPAPQPTPQEQQAANPAYIPEGPRATEEDAEEPETQDTLTSLFPDAPSDASSLAAPEKIERPTGVRRRDTETAEAEPEPVVVEEEQTAPNPRAEQLDADDEERNARIESENIRTAAIETPEFEPEEDPFAPLGLRLGTFNVITTLEQGLTWTSNARYSPDPKSSVLSETTLRLNALSDWSRHSATINGYGTYRRSIDGEKVDDPSAGIDARLNLDFSDSLRGVATLGYALRREDASSPIDLPLTVTSRPLRQDLSGSLGLEKDVGKFRFAATGNLSRQHYGEAELQNGTTLSQDDRNSTLATAVLRTGYEISPALTPFVELEYGRRFYDETIDAGGYERSSDRMAVRAGAELDLGEKLTGELAVGYVNESFDDERLDDVAGLSTSAALVWSPERGTTVNFNASTEVEGSTTAGDSGSLLYSGTVSIERQLRANLTGSASLGLSWRDYASTSDSDLTWRGSTSLTWWLNRYAGITSRYAYEQLDSTRPNRDSTVHTVYLGMTLRR